MTQQDKPLKSGDDKTSEGNLDNGSNPSPYIREDDQMTQNQLLDEKAEKYIREAGNIEDLPDPEEQQEEEK